MDKIERATMAALIQTDLSDARSIRKEQTRSRPQLRKALRSWQRERLRTTHAQALLDPATSAAAFFFLEEIYPVSTAAWRDSQAFSALSSLCKLLPDAALEALAAAAAMDRLTEELDAAWCEHWLRARGKDAEFSQDIDPASYQEAYRRCDAQAREAQLKALSAASASLMRVSGMPLASGALRAMKFPARLAGLSDLQEFLERGYRIFSELSRPEEFCQQLQEREERFMAEMNFPSSQA